MEAVLGQALLRADKQIAAAVRNRYPRPAAAGDWEISKY